MNLSRTTKTKERRRLIQNTTKHQNYLLHFSSDEASEDRFVAFNRDLEGSREGERGRQDSDLQTKGNY